MCIKKDDAWGFKSCWQCNQLKCPQVIKNDKLIFAISQKEVLIYLYKYLIAY